MANQLKADKKVTVKPNANNQIVAAQKKNCFCCFGFAPCRQMDGRIIKLALSVLEKTKLEKHEANEKEQLRILITKVEKLLEATKNTQK